MREFVNLINKARDTSAEDDFLFVLSHAAIRSPEFGVVGGKATRFLNWRVGRNGAVRNSFATRLNNLLFDQPWTADAGAANGALQLANWASGAPRAKIEKIVEGVRLGTIHGISRDVAWILSGVADIISSVTSTTLADESKPSLLRGDGDDVRAVRQLSRAIRRQSIRLGSGVPSDVLWMTELRLQPLQSRLRREEVMGLRTAGLLTPLALMDGSDDADEKRRLALGQSARGGLANLIRDAARNWRREHREHCRTLHVRRASRLGIGGTLADLYDKRGTGLEEAFAEALSGLAIPWQKLDRSDRQAYPDYLVSVEEYTPIVWEVKSKISNEDMVSLNSATEVLSASELAGLRESPCVTLCSPTFDPSVPTAIEAAQRLCVLDVSDFCEAVLRLHEGTLTRSGFYNWLTTPGVALSEGLPSPATR